MVTFTVHEPSNPEADRLDRADELQFVKDGFSWMTALCPPLGYAANSLWLPALAYLVLLSAAVAGFVALGGSEALAGIFVLALNVYLGFELSSLKRWSLDNSGWSLLGTVTGRSLAECERRFFESWLPAQPIIKTTTTSAAAGQDPRRAGSGWPFGTKA